MTLQNSTLWVYDEQQLPDGLDVPGQLTDTRHTIHAGEDVGSHYTALSYDSLGRVSGREITIDGLHEFEEAFTYDELGRPFQKFDASDDFAGVRYHYNSSGYLSRISESAIAVDGDAPVDYYRIDVMDARGNAVIATLGNGAQEWHSYEADRGYIVGMGTVASAGAVQSLALDYDAVGNVISRHDQGLSKVTGVAKDVNETFTYDALNRLRSAGTGSTADYDARGNIRNKSGAGSYQYVSTTSNRVQSINPGTGTIAYQYDNKGNIISGDGRTLQYTTFNKPHRITRGSNVVRFAYDGDRSRYKRTVDGKTTWYVGNVEITEEASGALRYTRYVEGKVIVKVTRADETDPVTGFVSTSRVQDSLSYIIADHLGSPDVILDDTGALEHDLSFDAWGRRRSPDPANAIIQNPVSVVANLIELTPRGYTGHEMLDTVGLIHMNGRVYDPRLGRFLSADPFVQDPFYSQSHNRYVYVWNNPLRYNDPSGHFVFTLGVGIDIAAKGGVNWALAGVLLGAAGTADALIAGAPLDQALKSGLISGVSGAAFSAFGLSSSKYFISDKLMRTVTVSTIGGMSSVLRGGRFGHGFLAAGIGTAVSSSDLFVDAGPVERVTMSAIVGGTTSEITGGKFANGAATAAFVQLLSEASSYYEGEVGRKADATPGENKPGKTDYSFDADGRQLPDSQDQNVVGLNKPMSGDYWEDFTKQGGPISKALNAVPTVNATAGLHDYWFNKPNALNFKIWNVPTMLPAAGISIGAVFGNYTRGNEALIMTIYHLDDQRRRRDD